MTLNLLHKEIGKIVVVEKLNKVVKGHSVWLCQCECGNTFEAFSYNLKRGYPKGCRVCNPTKDCSRNKKNTFEQDSVDPSITYMYDLKGNMCIVDTKNVDKIKGIYWRQSPPNNYWVSSPSVGLHRFILDCPTDMDVDHKFHKRYDNRESQLRICTRQENQINKVPKLRPVNPEIPQGVYPTEYGKFRVAIRTKQVKKFKNFDTLDEAITQRKLWENEYLGEFQYQP